LWRSDGTPAGTEFVRDLFPGAAGSSPEGLLWGGGVLWFTADDGASGRELWKTDGAAATLVKDIRPGAAGSVPRGSALMAWAGGHLALMADDGANGRELWTSDGTAAGTVLAGEVIPGPRGGDPAWLAAAGNRVIFSADDGTRGREPWFYSPNAAPVDIAVSPPAVPENRPAGTLVGTLSAIDPDFGDSFSFALVSGVGDTGNALFAISGTSLLTAAAFDFESRPAHAVRVRVTDRGGLSFEKALSIAVTDVDEGPSIRPVAVVPVIANLAAPIGGLSVSDPFAGATRLTTTLSAGAGLLTIGARTGLVFLAGDGVSDATIRFTGTLAQTNAALGSLSHITAIDTLAATGISVLVQRGGFAAQATVPMVVAMGRVARISDPGLPGKVSVVIQGTESADAISALPVGSSSANYTVTLNGVSTAMTGVTGRFLVFGLGGNDIADLSACRLVSRVDAGDGNDVILGGAMADTLLGGNGADLIAGGLGADGINGGAGNDIVIDGTVSVRAAGKTLRSVLDGWAAKAAPAESDYASVATDLAFTPDKSSRDYLIGGQGIDWFWSATAGALTDITDIAAGERRRLA